MSRRIIVILGLVAVLMVAAIAPLGAQDDNVVASDLNGPRKIAVDDDGTLYIVESGLGGENEAPGPFGSDVNYGGTGQVTTVSADGEQEVFIGDLPSSDDGFRGPMSILLTEDSIWLALGEGPIASPFNQSVVGLDRETFRVFEFIDIWSAEQAENADGDGNLSNPSDLALADDGTLYISDAGCNCLWSWTADSGLSVAAAWVVEDISSVPTSVDIGPDGDVYVGFLSGFPFPTGGARIERWSGGELVQTFDGLTLVTDIWFAEDGTLYAVEMAEGFGDNGYIPDTGRIIIVSDDGITPVVEGLAFPYGIAPAPDGGFYVSINSLQFGADIGAVIQVGG